MEKKTTLESLKPLAVKAAQVLKAAAQVADEILSDALHRYGEKHSSYAPGAGSEESTETSQRAPESSRPAEKAAPPVHEGPLEQPREAPERAPTGPASIDAAPQSVWVVFEAIARTEYGETVCLVGSTPALGAWDPKRAIQLIVTDYPKWQQRVQVEADRAIEYKYLRKNVDGSFTWEASSANRVRSDPATRVVSPDEVDWED